MIASRITAPYYREYLAQFSGGELGNAMLRSSKENGIFEAFDFDTSMRQTANLFSYKVPERSFAPAITDGNESFKFDHVSNAAFVSYRNTGANGEPPVSTSTGSGCETSGQSSTRTASPLSTDQPNRIVKVSQGVVDELLEEDEEVTSVVVSAPKPSYKHILDMKYPESKAAASYESLNSENLGDDEGFEKRRIPLRTSVEKSKEEPRKQHPNGSPKNDRNAKPKRPSIKRIIPLAEDAKAQTKLELKAVGKIETQNSISSNTPTKGLRRPLLTPGEVFSALVPAVTINGPKQQQFSGSEFSGLKQQAGGSEAVSSTPLTKPEQKGVAREQKRSLIAQSIAQTTDSQQQPKKKAQPIPIPGNASQQRPRGQSLLVPHDPTLSDQQPPPQQKKKAEPKKLHTYFQWGNMFRLPTHAAPPTAINQNRFQFPRHEHTSKRFLKSLESFRRTLQRYRGEKIRDVLFEDFEPKLNYVNSRSGEEIDQSDFKKTRQYSLTDSQPIKIFNSSPERTWIPVRCDAIGFDLRVLEAGIGHGEKNDKAQISIVYDANREARERAKDPNGRNPVKRVTYIRKEYYDTEYFLNEYNFFQFAHLPYLPKPFCVEYDPHPTIVMEHVPGERIHHTLYRFGQFLRSKHPENREAMEEEMKTTLIKLLAKILVTIKYIHSIGFIHADIKPENIMYDPITGRVVMIDFDLTVSAPFVFTGRGTGTTIAPELNGLLQGPVHFGIDWWAYGSTAAMMISSGFAGILFDPVKEKVILERYFNYVPFMYVKGENRYEMTPIPEFFPPAMRSFLYPFFNPDPSLRVFSEHNAYNWIRSHPLFTNVISDWTRYEQLDMGAYSVATPMHIGLTAFSKRPVLLLPLTRLHKIISGISNMLYLGTSATTKDGTLANVEDSDDESEEEDSEDEDSEYDDDEDDSEDAESGVNVKKKGTWRESDATFPFQFER